MTEITKQLITIGMTEDENIIPPKLLPENKPDGAECYGVIINKLHKLIEDYYAQDDDMNVLRSSRDRANTVNEQLVEDIKKTQVENAKLKERIKELEK